MDLVIINTEKMAFQAVPPALRTAFLQRASNKEDEQTSETFNYPVIPIHTEEKTEFLNSLYHLRETLLSLQSQSCFHYLNYFHPPRLLIEKFDSYTQTFNYPENHHEHCQDHSNGEMIDDWVFELKKLLTNLTKIKLSSHELIQSLEQFSLISFGYDLPLVTSTASTRMPPIARIEANRYKKYQNLQLSLNKKCNDDDENIDDNEIKHLQSLSFNHCCSPIPKKLRISFSSTIDRLKNIYEVALVEINKMKINETNTGILNKNDNNNDTNDNSNTDQPNENVLLIDFKKNVQLLESKCTELFVKTSEIGFENLVQNKSVFNNKNNPFALIQYMTLILREVNESVELDWNFFNSYIESKLCSNMMTASTPPTTTSTREETFPKDQSVSEPLDNVDTMNNKEEEEEENEDLLVERLKKEALLKTFDQLSALRNHYDTVSIELYLAQTLVLETLQEDKSSLNKTILKEEHKYDVQMIKNFLRNAESLASAPPPPPPPSCSSSSSSSLSPELNICLSSLSPPPPPPPSTPPPPPSTWRDCDTFLSFVNLDKSAVLLLNNESSKDKKTQHMCSALKENDQMKEASYVLSSHDNDDNDNDKDDNDEDGDDDDDNDDDKNTTEVLVAFGGYSLLEKEEQKMQNGLSYKKGNPYLKYNNHPKSKSILSTSSTRTNFENKKIFVTELKGVLETRKGGDNSQMRYINKHLNFDPTTNQNEFKDGSIDSSMNEVDSIVQHETRYNIAKNQETLTVQINKNSETTEHSHHPETVYKKPNLAMFLKGLNPSEN